MNENERRLLTLLEIQSFKRGPFRLASGVVGDYHIDATTTTVDFEGAYLVGEVLHERTKGLGIEAIGGPQVGAIPLATATVIAYHRHGGTMTGFWVRPEVKSPGPRGRIEGGLVPGSRVAIVDDVCTTGASALETIWAVRAIGCKVVVLIALVDRLMGAEDLLRRNGVPDYRAVFTIRDFGIYG